MNIKDAVFKKHISLLAAGIRSDYFDQLPQEWDCCQKTIVQRTILATWPR